MESKLKEEWMKEPTLRKWHSKSCVQKTNCSCKKPQLVELWEHDSCVIGRIDTTVCTKCDNIKTFKIVR